MKQLSSLIRRLRKRERIKTFLIWATFALLSAFIAGIGFSVAYLVLPLTLHPSYIVWGSIGLAVLVSAGGAFFTKYDAEKILKRADARLGQKGRLITAYDLERKNSDNPFRQIVSEEAEDIAGRANEKTAVAVAFPKQARLLPLLFFP